MLTEMKKIPTGIASYGMSGKIFHAPLLHVHPGFKIISILERYGEKSLQTYPYVRIAKTYEEMLAARDIDLIIVNTPDHLHTEMAELALDAGKHVIVEKPFTLSVSDADKLIRKAAARGLMLSVFHNRRWDGDFLTVQKLLAGKVLGRLVEFEAHFDRYRNYIQSDTWKESAGTGTGTLYNLGSHLIDQALVLFGMPESVTADIRKQRTGSQVDDAFTLWLMYHDIRVTLKAGYLIRQAGPRYILHGTNGSFLKPGIDPQEDQLKAGIFPAGPDWGKDQAEDWGLLNTDLGDLHFTGKVETIAGNYGAYYDSIYQTIVNGEKPAVTAEQARDVIRIIEVAFQSHQKRTSISL
jgi:predicted dehydrogenase